MKKSSSYTRIHLIRHGAVHNPDGVLYGRLPGFPLSERGFKMADFLVDYIQNQLGKEKNEKNSVQYDINVSEIISSPLLRTVQTATPISKALGIELKTDERIIEADSPLTGVSLIKNRFVLLKPKYYKYYVNPFTPSWQEAHSKIAMRMSSAINEAVKNRKGTDVLMFSHRSPIDCVRRYYLARPLWHMPNREKCAYASITTLHFDKNNHFLGFEYSDAADRECK